MSNAELKSKLAMRVDIFPSTAPNISGFKLKASRQGTVIGFDPCCDLPVMSILFSSSLLRILNRISFLKIFEQEQRFAFRNRPVAFKILSGAYFVNCYDFLK